MAPNAKWQAARQSGWLAGKTFGVGWISLALALFILHKQTGQISIQAMLHQFNPSDGYQLAALALITLTAMTQSAIWPFHRWLVSSLNSPTPVSAVMHAGLVKVVVFCCTICANVFGFAVATQCFADSWFPNSDGWNTVEVITSRR